MKRLIIHAKHSRARHIPRKALRSTLYHFVTCKVCRRQRWPSTTPTVQIHQTREQEMSHDS